jgi:AraC family transcriptional regulator
MQTNQKLINRAIDYIVENMTLSPDLEKVASIAGFSKFHFHRIFKEYTGETLASFTKRIRLEHSAFLLVFYKERTIRDIALSCGFSSSQSFATAFKAYYRVSPSTYKEKRGCAGIVVDDPQLIAKYKVKIQYIESFSMVYYRSFGAYSHENVVKKQKEIAQKHPNKTYIGISWDNPHITPNQHCRYDYGYVVDDGEFDKLLPKQTIESETYAILTIPKKSADIAKIWEYLYLSWLPRHGYKPHRLFCFEIILDDASNISFYLPVKKI